MSRFTGPRVKRMRALGTELPGLSPKKIDKRPYPPGQHGQGRKKLTEFALRLQEKQKLRLKPLEASRGARAPVPRASSGTPRASIRRERREDLGRTSARHERTSTRCASDSAPSESASARKYCVLIPRPRSLLDDVPQISHARTDLPANGRARPIFSPRRAAARWAWLSASGRSDLEPAWASLTDEGAPRAPHLAISA
ncbi:MAG: hypothetical protein KF850_04615 [Labilithrix sp.]|nr:hypothetical protein [Labilithrix sp.]